MHSLDLTGESVRLSHDRLKGEIPYPASSGHGKEKDDEFSGENDIVDRLRAGFRWIFRGFLKGNL